MNGWELDKPNEDILFGKHKRIKEYVQQYPLAGTDKKGDVLLIIRKYHPSLNCSPDDPYHRSDTYRMCLAYYDATSYMYFELPGALSYTGVEVEMDKNTGKPVITIHANGISRTTNVTELYQKLSNYTPMEETAKMQAFESLENAVNTVQRTPIEVTEIGSDVLGTLKQDEQFDDWWHSHPIPIPYLDGQELTFTYTDLNPAEDGDFAAEADQTTGNFLGLTVADRLAASAYVYKNCMEFLDAIGYNEEDDVLWKITDPQQIWQHVRYNQCYVSREPYEDHKVYLRLSCECDWEPEHGLQLVFNDQGKLIRVSAEDGHILGYEGDGMIS